MMSDQTMSTGDNRQEGFSSPTRTTKKMNSKNMVKPPTQAV
jgi:hypothetical protein